MLIAVDGTGSDGIGFISDITINSTQEIREYFPGPRSALALQPVRLPQPAPAGPHGWNPVAGSSASASKQKLQPPWTTAALGDYGEVPAIAAKVVERICAHFRQQNDATIHMAGHSRGAAIVILAAQSLLQWADTRQLKVGCMALFDTVDRDLFTDCSFIPPNVERVFHAIRNPEVNSRSYFGVPKLQYTPATKYESHLFTATHAGMGGAPTTGDRDPMPGVSVAKRAMMAGPLIAVSPTISLQKDIEGAAQVKSWMWPRLREWNVVR